MASKVSGVIEKINVSGTERAIASSAYGYCETAAGTAAKVVDMTDFKLYEGVTIHVKFKEKNSAENPTLNVQGTGAKPIVMYGTTATPSNDDTNSWYAGAVLSLTYDGTSWIKSQAVNDTKYTLTAATTSALGGIKIGYTTSGTNYKVQLDSNNNAYVSVPWSNTATAVDNILDGSNSGTAITYAPYSGQQAKLSFDVSTTDPTRTDRLNLNGNFHATNLYGDTAVIDNMVTLKYNTTDSALEFVFG